LTGYVFVYDPEIESNRSSDQDGLTRLVGIARRSRWSLSRSSGKVSVVPRGHGWPGSKEYNAKPKRERYFATRRIIVIRHNYNILHPHPQLTRFEAAHPRYSTFNHEHNFPLEIKLELSTSCFPTRRRARVQFPRPKVVQTGSAGGDGLSYSPAVRAMPRRNCSDILNNFARLSATVWSEENETK
jgi:hypothetical protein